MQGGNNSLSSSEKTPVFIGQYTHTVDEKGRLSIPSKYRAELSGTLYLTFFEGAEPCIRIYPEAEFTALVDELARLPQVDPSARAVTRSITGNSFECRLDPQGRIVIPPFLRSKAAIGSEALIVGVARHAEIWAKETWEANQNQQQELSREGLQQRIGFQLGGNR